MTDFRKFSLGLFVGMAGAAALMNHGFYKPPPELGGGGVAMIVCGLMLASLAVIWFGDRKA